MARAVRYHHAAGDNARARSAARLAIEHYRRALQLLLGLPDSHERTQREISLNIALGPLLLACEGFGAPACEKAYKRAQDLCDRIGATRELFTALWGLWLYNQGNGHFDHAEKIGQRLLEIATVAHDRSLLLQAHHALWATSFVRGELLACIAHATVGAELYEVGQHAGMAARYGNHDAGACGLCFHAVALALHGDLVAARAASQAAIRLTEELAHPFSQVLALCLAAISEQIAGEHAPAQQRAEQSARLAAEHGFAQMSAWASCVSSWSMVVNGEHAPGISGILAALNAARATGTRMYQSYFFGVLADAYRIAGSTSEGLAAARGGLDAARTTNERFYEAELLRLEGELERSNGAEPLRCAGLFERAAEISRHQAAHLLELRALTSLVRTREGELCAPQLRRIGELLGSLTLHDDSADAREARLLLRGSQRNPTAIS